MKNANTPRHQLLATSSRRSRAARRRNAAVAFFLHHSSTPCRSERRCPRRQHRGGSLLLGDRARPRVPSGAPRARQEVLPPAFGRIFSHSPREGAWRCARGRARSPRPSCASTPSSKKSVKLCATLICPRLSCSAT